MMTSCVSSNYQVADTVDKGDVEVGFFIDYHSWIGVLLTTGIADNLDVGIQATVSSVPEINVRYRFFSKGSDTNRLAIALKPYVGFGYLNEDDDRYYYKAGISLIGSKKVRKTTSIFLITTYNINYLENITIHGFKGTLGLSEDFFFLWIRPEITIDFQEKINLSPGLAIGFNF